MGSPMDSSLQRLKFINIINSNSKIAQQNRIHTQVCLTQAHGYSSTHNVSRAVRRVVTSIWPEIPTRANTPQTFFSIYVWWCVGKSAGPQGDLSPGRSELCLFLATVLPHLLLTIESLDLHPRDTFYSNTRQSEECNGWNYVNLQAWNCFSQGKKDNEPQQQIYGNRGFNGKKEYVFMNSYK